MISKVPVHGTGCLVKYNFLDSQRPDVIVTANESPHTGGHDDLDSCSNNIVPGHENQAQSSKTYGSYDHLSSSNRPCRRYYSSVQPLYESCEWKRGRRKALKSRQRAILVNLEARTPHQRQYFRKFGHFQNFGCMHLLDGTV